MANLKENIESGKTLYDNLKNTSKDDDKIKIKDMLKKTYTEYTNSENMVKLFSDHDNYEIYDNTLFSHPIVCIFKDTVLNEVYNSSLIIGSLNYFETKDKTKIIYPVIILSENIFNSGNTPLINYVLAHELGHYRRNHVSTIYFEDDRRHILKEVEADLYACSVIGVEGCISGLRELVKFLIENEPTSDVDEVLKRLTFISRKYDIRDALQGLNIKKEK